MAIGAESYIVSIGVSAELDQVLGDIAGRMGATYRAVASGERLLSALGVADVAVVVWEDAGDGSDSEGLEQWLRNRVGTHPPLLVVRTPRLEPAVAAMQRGVYAVHRFSPLMSELESSIRAALEASVRISGEVRRWQRITRQLETLTDGELQVLRCMLEGFLNKRIASYLKISERTVEARRKRIFEKMGSASVAQLVRGIVETVGCEDIARRCEGSKVRPPAPHWNAALLRVAGRAYRDSDSGPHSQN